MLYRIGSIFAPIVAEMNDTDKKVIQIIMVAALGLAVWCWVGMYRR